MPSGGPYPFSKHSRARLATCHPDLVRVALAVAERRNCSVIEGARSDQRQAMLYATGRSHRDGVVNRSAHQVRPGELSRAIDLAPYYAGEVPSIPWDTDTKEKRARWYHFAGFVLGVAKELGVELTWGGDWDGDGRHDDQSFHDLPHFELV